MTKEMIFNNKYFNIFILFINTSIIDAFFKALFIPASLISAIRLITNLIFIAAVIYYLLTARIKSRRYIITIIFLIFTGMTILWTTKKVEAIKLYINFIGACSYFVLFFCISYKENVLKTLKGYCNLLIISNILALTILPGVGFMGTDPKELVLSGIHLSRSTMIVYMNFCIFIYAYYLKEFKLTDVKKLRIWIMIFLATLIVILSKSSTGIITVVLFLPLLFFNRFKKLGKVLLTISIAIGVALPLIKFTSSFLNNIIHGLFGKNLTFSGRTYIWQYALDKLIANPIVGSGFNSSMYLFQNKVVPIYERVAAHAHNGFLEVYMQLGAIGVIIIVLLLIFTFKQACRLKYKESIVIKSYLIVFIIFNFMEPYFIGNISVITLWLPIIYITTLAHKKMKEKYNA